MDGAAGVLQVDDTAQLHGRPVRAKVKIRKDPSGQYEEQNEVSGFEAGAGAAAPAIQSPVPSPAAAASAAPWKRVAA